MIRRRWTETVVCALACAGLLSWAAHLPFFGAAVAGIFGVALGVLAVLGPASGECPSCKKMLHGLFAIGTSDFERCPHCRVYFRRGGQEVAHDLIADHPAFSVPIDQGERLPNLCCVCGQPAKRVDPFVHSTEGKIAHTNAQVLKTVIKIPVPYCADHKDDVSVWNEDLAPSAPLIEGGQQVTDNRWVLKVRSYGFYREAVR